MHNSTYKSPRKAENNHKLKYSDEAIFMFTKGHDAISICNNKLW